MVFSHVVSIPAPSGAWAAEIRMKSGLPKGELLLAHANGERVACLRLENGLLKCTLETRWDGTSGRFQCGQKLAFTLESPVVHGLIRVEWLGYTVRLLADGALMDEEWPVGALLGGTWDVEVVQDVSVLSLEPVRPGQTLDSDKPLDRPMQFFVPDGHNTGVGDCMPFSRDGRYCLYYLFDRRSHGSKAGLGAHQWAQISSADLKHWTVHPMAVGITEAWEGSICTGSLIQKEGKTYAFYAVRASDGSPAKLTHAVSEDGVRFEKSGVSFALTTPYEPVSARDPMVFEGADGLFHMLVTTSLTDRGRCGGCLAHLTSEDLARWDQREPFLIPGYADQPECCDYFEWNGWYYLVFSNFGTARYRMSRLPFGPWNKPRADVLDTVEGRVAKTAAFQGRRLSSSFLSRFPRRYAGCAVTHELFQRDDGTLGVKFVEEILPTTLRKVELPVSRLEATEGRIHAKWHQGSARFRLKATLIPSGNAPLYGLSLRFGERTYLVTFDPAERCVQALRPGQEGSGGEARNQLRGVEGLDAPIGLDLIVYNDVLDLALSNGRALTLRLEAESGECELSAFAMWGGMEVSAASLDEFER